LCDVELREALEEGVRVSWLRTITQVGDGSLTLEKMVLDDDGHPQPTGELEEIAGDAVILALGQDVDRSLVDTIDGLEVVDGVLQVDPAMMTGAPGVFACGDAAPSARSVTVAIGQGKAAAVSMDRWLTRSAPAAQAPAAPATGSGPGPVPVAFGQLNAWYYSEAPHGVRDRLDAARRRADFAEVVVPLDPDTAL
jgi:pyruvate/2-oxoglutarate dehydrogenase complex dihydrolipoamide dehydrogenase (E3) component